MNMNNFTRGLEPKKAMNTGHSKEIGLIIQSVLEMNAVFLMILMALMKCLVHFVQHCINMAVVKKIQPWKNYHIAKPAFGLLLKELAEILNVKIIGLKNVNHQQANENTRRNLSGTTY